MRSMPRWIAATAAVVAVQYLVEGAEAHHMMDGETPRTLMAGILSGIGHPIIGLDHLAFIVGVGLLSAIAGYGLIVPLLFVVAMAFGLGLHVIGLEVPRVELMLAVSVVMIGLAVFRPRSGNSRGLEGILFALAGLLHGYAFAETVIGAETAPLAGYIAGLAATQMAVAATFYYMARMPAEGSPLLAPIGVRVAGAAIAVVGVAFVVIQGGAVV